MTTFVLTLDLTDHVHEHSPRSHLHLIGQMLADASGAVGRSDATEGELIYPPGSHRAIGSWKFLDEATTEEIDMSKTKIEGAGMTAPKPPAPSGPHISDAVREKLKDLDPELAAGIRRVADQK